MEILQGFVADSARCEENGEVVVGDEGEEVDPVAEFEGKTPEMGWDVDVFVGCGKVDARLRGVLVRY